MHSYAYFVLEVNWINFSSFVKVGQEKIIITYVYESQHSAGNNTTYVCVIPEISEV